MIARLAWSTPHWQSVEIFLPIEEASPQIAQSFQMNIRNLDTLCNLRMLITFLMLLKTQWATGELAGSPC